VLIPLTTRLCEVRLVVLVTPKVLIPLTFNAVKFPVPPFTFVATVAVSALPRISPTNVFAYISSNLYKTFPIS